MARFGEPDQAEEIQPIASLRSDGYADMLICKSVAHHLSDSMLEQALCFLDGTEQRSTSGSDKDTKQNERGARELIQRDSFAKKVECSQHYEEKGEAHVKGINC